jgi:hypothetical protein
MDDFCFDLPYDQEKRKKAQAEMSARQANQIEDEIKATFAVSRAVMVVW